MFDIAWTELLVVAVVAIVVVGPKELPRLLRTLGQYAAKIRAMANDFKQQLDDAVKETGIDEVKSDLENLKNPVGDLRSALNPLDDDYEEDFKKMAAEEGLDEAAQADEEEAFWEEYDPEASQEQVAEKAHDTDQGSVEEGSAEGIRIVEPEPLESTGAGQAQKRDQDQGEVRDKKADPASVSAQAQPKSEIEPIKPATTVNGASAPALEGGRPSKMEEKSAV